jgi:hypothetical protein
MIRNPATWNTEPDERTVSDGAAWNPTSYTRCEQPANVLVDQLAAATPMNSTLLRWAALPINQPPQSWWDDTTDPFEPDEE